MTPKELFLAALDLPAAARDAFLAGIDPDLRPRVAELLAAHAVSATPLVPGEATAAYIPGAPPLPETTTYSVSTDRFRIANRYELVERLGEGGMGEVWVALQTEPVKRKVALKLIKAGMDSKAVLLRFEQERQALALMDHPNIAKVLDGGLTPDQRPFFVMELVHGQTLTKFCDEGKLGIRERLELFVPICQAVQHAHQKGIVHRDLKPANILVTRVDGRPVPKVIDFGVAKATAGKLTDESLSTQFGAVVGTLEYMSPEQAGFSNEDIDTRADIYSLGVILYELLTGLRPLDAKRLKKAALSEMIRVIQEEEPSKPSTRLSTDAAAPSLAALRHTEPKKLVTLLRGELDWVVMKCLEKHRDRRYESANGLAREIQRYLADEPVEARPPSFGYRARKFLSRHRVPALAAAGVLLALIAGIVGTTLGLFEARHQAGVAETRRQDAEKAAQAEKLAKEQAQASLRQMANGVEILGSIFKDLKPGRAEAFGKSLGSLLAERLDAAAEALDGESVGDPAAVARLQVILAESQRGLGFPKKGIALGMKARDTLTRLLGPDARDTLLCMAHLAAAYQAAGQYDQSLPLYQQTLSAMQSKLGPDHEDTLAVMGNLGENYRVARQPDRALPLLEEALKKKRAMLGAEHPQTLMTANNLALVYMDVSRDAEAVPLLEECLKVTKERHGPNHPETLVTMGNLAAAYKTTGKLEPALALGESTLKAKRQAFGPDHPETLAAMNNQAMGYHLAGQLDKAIPLYEETLAKLRLVSGPRHDHTLLATHNLAKACLDAKKYPEAITLLADFVAGQRQSLANQPARLAGILVLVGNDLLQAGQFTEAERYLRDGLTLRLEKEREAWSTFNTQSLLGEALFRQKKYEEAEKLLLAGGEGLVQRQQAIPPAARFRVREALNRLVQFYTETGKPDEAVKWKKRLEAAPARP